MLRRYLLMISLSALLWTNATWAQSELFGPFSFCPGDGPATFEYQMQQSGPVRVVVEHIFNNLHVRTLVYGIQTAGSYTVVWDGKDDLGQDVGSGVYIITLSGDGWATDLWVSIDCGYDAAIPSRVTVGGKDVDMSFANIIDDTVPTELAIYTADGLIRVADFSNMTHHRYALFYWGFKDSLQNTLPAGDYIYRMASTSYAEDIPFSIDPIERSVLSATITDGNGDVVDWVSGVGDVPLVKGPLQHLEIDFGRRMSTAEVEYLLNGGIVFDGFLRWAQPNSPVVRGDSTGVVFHGFDLSRTWSDCWGIGSLWSSSMFEPNYGRWQIGFDHQGITAQDRHCQSTGTVDPADWIVNPDPFYFTVTGNIDAACNNPVPVTQQVEIQYTTDESGYVTMIIVDSDGNLVRLLLSDQLQAGWHGLQWDRLDDDGVEVPAGIYHFIWDANWQDGGAVVASGDIHITDFVSPVPPTIAGLAVPTLLGNHPNPFNPATTISFELPRAGSVALTVLSLDGRRVATLVDNQLESGRHTVTWHGRDDQGQAIPSGTYFYRLEAGGVSDTRRMLLLK